MARINFDITANNRDFIEKMNTIKADVHKLEESLQSLQSMNNALLKEISTKVSIYLLNKNALSLLSQKSA